MIFFNSRVKERYANLWTLVYLLHLFLEFWKGVEVKSKEKEKSPDLEKGIQNKDNKKSKQEQWEVSLSDDSWYIAPTFHPEVFNKHFPHEADQIIHRNYNPEEKN